MSLSVEVTGAGTPLALIHGWGFHSGVWDGFVPPLAQRYRVHLVDLPGHGRSRETPFGTLDEVADNIARGIPDGTVLCGWSLGGMLAQRVALRHPRKARSLVLVSTTPCFVARSGWEHGTQSATLDEFARGMQDDPAAALDAFLHLNAFAAQGARAAARALSQRLGERPQASREALDAGLALLRDTDLRGDVAGLSLPVIAIHGSRDRVVPVGAGRWLAASIAGARLIELPGSAHLPFVTDRDATLAALRAFDA